VGHPVLFYNVCPDLQKGLSRSDFPTKTRYTSHFSTISATCPAHLVNLDVVTRIMFGKNGSGSPAPHLPPVSCLLVLPRLKLETKLRDLLNKQARLSIQHTALLGRNVESLAQRRSVTQHAQQPPCLPLGPHNVPSVFVRTIKPTELHKGGKGGALWKYFPYLSFSPLHISQMRPHSNLVSGPNSVHSLVTHTHTHTHKQYNRLSSLHFSCIVKGNRGVLYNFREKGVKNCWSRIPKKPSWHARQTQHF
jgi:hypothetical protein